MSAQFPPASAVTSDPPGRLVRAMILATSSLPVMAGAIITPTLPRIRDVFADHPDALLLSKLTLTLPAIVIAVVAPLAGLWIDRFGRKPLLVTSLIVFGLGGTTGLYVDGFPALLGGRALLGLGIAGVMTAATTLIADFFDGEARNRFMGMQSVFMALGGMIYVTLGGALADISWRGPFAVYGVGFLFAVLAWRILSEPRGGERRDDGAVPLPMGLAPGLILVLGFLAMVMFYLIPVQLPFLLERIGPTTSLEIGLAIAVNTLAGALASWQYRRLRARSGYLAITILSALFVGSGFLAVGQAASYGAVAASLVLSGTGMGLLMPNLALWMVSRVPLRLRGRGIGALTTAYFLGQFCSPLIIQPADTRLSLSGAFHWSGLAALAAAAGLAALHQWNRRGALRV